MEDKTHYGMEGGTLVAATPPRGKPAPRGLTAVEVMALSERLLEDANRLMEESDCHGEKGGKYQQIFFLGESQGLGRAAKLLHKIARALDEGGNAD